MAKSKICAYPQLDNALTKWKCVLRFCSKFPIIHLPYQETYDQYSNTIPSIHFHIYHLIARCTTHGRLPLNEKKICRKCKQDYISEQSKNIYTIEDLVVMETTI